MAGIIGYGAYIPRFRIKIEDICKQWGKDPAVILGGIKVNEKAVGGFDEDSATIGVHASLNALSRASIDKSKIGAVYSGSESKVYAVKPNATIVGNALGLSENFTSADLEFACKGGSAGIQMCMGMCDSGMIEYGLAIGADTSQGRPGDVLEYTASSGGAAFVIGKDDGIAKIEKTLSITTDTPDFWRRNMVEYPSHGERFTGDPAYFYHVLTATKNMLESLNATVDEFDHFVFHMPNTKFPMRAAKKLGIDISKVKQSLVVQEIGNTYSGSSLLGLTATLDIAKPGERILMTSFGSGAGSDCFVMTVTDKIEDVRDKAPLTSDYIADKEYVDYGTYCRMRGKIL